MFWFWGTFVSLIKKASPTILNKSLGFLEAIKKRSLLIQLPLLVFMFTLQVHATPQMPLRRGYIKVCAFISFIILSCVRMCVCVSNTWSAREVDSMLISSLSAVNLHICSHLSFRRRSRRSKITPAKHVYANAHACTGVRTHTQI